MSLKGILYLVWFRGLSRLITRTCVKNLLIKVVQTQVVQTRTRLNANQKIVGGSVRALGTGAKSMEKKGEHKLLPGENADAKSVQPTRPLPPTLLATGPRHATLGSLP